MLLACLLSAAALSQQAASPDDCREAQISHVDGKQYIAGVTTGEVAATPTWDPSRSASPPLLPGDALRRASEVVRSEFPLARTWKPNEVSLVSFSSVAGYWYYAVQFVPEPRPQPGAGEVSMLRILVLMSGKVVAPKLFSGFREPE